MSFVRSALAEDAVSIARIQRLIWVEDYAPLTRGDIEFPSVEELTNSWRAAVENQSERARVLMATVENEVVGFAAVAPFDEATDEIEALHVDPSHRRAGHGTRLLTAVADTAQERGISALTTWVLEGDHPWTSLLNSSGFGVTSDQRILDFDGEGRIVMVQHRWHTSLQDQ